MFNNYDLIMFDLDGTLVEDYNSDIIPSDRLDIIKEVSKITSIAICTNQGGVGLRRWMEMWNFGEPKKYPTELTVRNRISRITYQMGRDVAVYVCFRYQTRKGKISPLPPEGQGKFEWDIYNRKPSPGMLEKAMKDAKAKPNRSLFIGNDISTDGLAAGFAGCAYEDIEEILSHMRGNK